LTPSTSRWSSTTAFGPEHVEHLRQVELPLRVVGAQRGQRRAQRLAGEGEDAGVDLADLALGLGRVAGALGLDHAQHAAVVVAHDAPVAARVIEHRARHRRGGAGALVRGDELADRLGAHQRHVAAEDHDGRVIGLPVQRGQPRGGGAAGAVGDLLHGYGHAIGQHRLERARGRVDHDDPLRARRQRRAHGPEDHRQAADLVQRLGRARAHACALAGGEYQYAGGGHALMLKERARVAGTRAAAPAA
jgi:hypothetical protein